jgi:hypothetical protein
VNTYEDPEIEKKGIQFMVEKQPELVVQQSVGKVERI